MRPGKGIRDEGPGFVTVDPERTVKGVLGASHALTLSLSRGERGKALFAVLLALLPVPVLAQERAIPFWPDDVPGAIHAAVDGNAALETVRGLSRFHRVHGSPGMAAAAEHVKKKLLAAGLRSPRSRRRRG